MKKIVLVFALISLAIPSQAQFLKNLLRLGGDILVGATDALVQNSDNIDQQTKDNWNNYVKPNLPTSYGTNAGSKLTNSDYAEAINDIASNIAIDAGVNEEVVALGNSGVNNMINGNNNAAMIDATEMVGTAMGVKGIDRVCETQRNINQINQEYRESIKKGMSIEKATQIRNSKLGTEIGNLWYEEEEAYKEAQREKARQKREMLCEGIMQRGYNEMEAKYYSSFINLSEVDANDPSSIGSVLNMYHIAYKEPSDTGAFFDAGYEIPAPIIEEKPVTPVITPKPVDPSADAKARLKEIAADRYLINHVDLNKTQKEKLDEVASLMNQYPNIRICLNGNTCDLGSDYVNELIATKRANHAKDYLVKQGVDANRIETESKAASNPVVAGKTEESRLQNRRVSIIVLDD